MPTQKVFKQRVRARMAKTGEAYTTARHQLLRKASDPDAPPAPPVSLTAETTNPIPSDAMLVADEAMFTLRDPDRNVLYAVQRQEG